MGLLDFNPRDHSVIQRQLRERGDELSDRAATAIADLRNQVEALQHTRDDVRRQVHRWAHITHRLVQVSQASLKNKRVLLPKTTRWALTYLIERAEQVMAAAMAGPDPLLPPAPRRVQVGRVAPAEWKEARLRRGRAR